MSVTVIRPSDAPLFSRASIFLAGPTHRGEYVGKDHWREKAITLLKEMKFIGVVLAPEPMSGDYSQQVGWENESLTAASVILFWIPRDLEVLPGFTTNVEFGEWMKSGKVVLGYPQGAPKMRYLHTKADKYEIPVYHTLEEAVRAAANRAQKGIGQCQN